MNWDGEEALYVYDTKEQTIQRFVEGNKSQTFVDEPQAENTEYLAMKRQYDELKGDYDNMDKKISKKNKIIMILITILVIGIIIAAFVIYKLTSDKRNDFYLKDDKTDNGGNDDEIGAEYSQTADNITSVQHKVESEPEVLTEVSDNQKETLSETEQNKDLQASEESIFFTKEQGADITENRNINTEKSSDVTSFKKEKADDSVGVLIDMEDEAAFEIEFVDLEDKK